MREYAIDYQGGLSNAFSHVAEFVPRLLAFLVILVIGWFVAKIVAKIVNGVLERVGFDRLVERGGVHQALAHSNYDASDIIAKLAYYALLLITLVIAFNVFGPNPVSTLLSGVVAFLPKLAVAILIVIVAAAVASAVKDLVSGALGGLSYGSLLANIAAAFIIGVGVIAALSQIGVAVAVTMPILIAVLATIGGILVVGVGGGLIRPMQSRWEQFLARAEQELPAVRAQAQTRAPRPTWSDGAEGTTGRSDGSTVHPGAGYPQGATSA